VHHASRGRFGPDPSSLYDSWDAFTRWADEADPRVWEPSQPLDEKRLGPPSPTPRQIVAIGLNYAEHAAETGFGTDRPAVSVFTKFPSCLTGAYATVELPADGWVDWEVELVVVMARPTKEVSADAAWAHIAGVCVGQDLSERRLQMAANPPQFSLAKSYPGFGPTGPWLVTPDELDWSAGLELGCSVNGTRIQSGNTHDMIHDVPALIEHVSSVITLNPGDLIFTGTPPGVGMARTPQRWLAPGDTLVSWIEGIGRLQQVFTRSASQ
jgi:2-keto-4-pentenoate hydratase/2-oxohepta-3-ene-1,7-dioic acid hydratase in catechol pathway